MSRRPHVLLLVLDAARRDAFGPYDAGARTPAISALARRGVAVPHAYATAPWTLPSHIAMFTGALASEFGLDQAPGGNPRGAAEAIAPLADRLLAARLAAAGYATHGYSANLWISPHSGLDAGFADFSYVPSERLERAFGVGAVRRRAALAWAREGWASARDDGAATIGAQLSATIARVDPRTPQFFFVNLVEAHSPYLPPRPFNDLGAAERIRAALDCDRLLNFESICVAAAGGLAGPPAALARLAHLHRRSVAYLDAWLAGVLAALRRRAMLEDTLVIVCSDHGECFGEDGLLAHGFSLIEPLIHVPLVAAGPGAETFGARSGADAGALSLRELPRLIAGAAGLEVDLDDFGPPGDGVALARAAAICAPADPRMLSLAERWSLSPVQVARLTGDRWSATDGVARLTVTDGVAESEPTRAEAPAALLAALERAAGGRTPGPADLGRPGPPSAGGSDAIRHEAPAAAPADAEAVAALERQMKLLGYM